MTGSIGVCAHCHQRHATVRLYRIVGLGPRPLCAACYRSLDALGMNIRAAGVMWSHLRRMQRELAQAQATETAWWKRADAHELPGSGVGGAKLLARRAPRRKHVPETESEKAYAWGK